jgi:uncharacterized phiE125 gp8 family phage protein
MLEYVNEDRLIWRNLTPITAPADHPMTLAEAKEHLRVTWSEEDDRIDSLTQAAIAYLDGRDGILGRALAPQTWEYTLERFPVCAWIDLPLPPVQSITSVIYKDVNGSPQTWGGSNYSLGADKQWRPRIIRAPSVSWPATWGEPEAVTIRAVHGYASGADVPEPIRQALLLLIGHWYSSREAVAIGTISKDIEFAVGALVAPYQLTSF